MGKRIRGSDVVAVTLSVALCVPIMFPMFRTECMDEKASEVYEQLVIAAIAIVAAYVGSRSCAPED